MDELRELYSYDRSFPAFYYPAYAYLWRDNPAQDPSRLLPRTLESLRAIDSDTYGKLSPLEQDLHIRAVVSRDETEEQRIFDEVLSYLQELQLPEDAMDRIRMMSLIATY